VANGRTVGLRAVKASERPLYPHANMPSEWHLTKKYGVLNSLKQLGAGALGEEQVKPTVSKHRLRNATAGSSRRLVLSKLVITCLLLSGCSNFGSSKLESDQVGYARALTEGQKRQTLLNIVQLRYADAPVFVNTTQVISSYQLQHSATAGFEAFPGANAATFLTGTGSVQLQQTPTFTFQPVSGQAFARSYLRPLSPPELLSLSLSGLPIDVLFRLAIQSINDHENRGILEGPAGGGHEDFARLLVNLRKLQLANLLNFRLESSDEQARTQLAGRLIVTLNDSPDRATQKIVEQTRRLLGMPATVKEAEVVYGKVPTKAGEIAMLTRPILGVLAQASSEIDVPPDDIRRGLTDPGMRFSPLLNRPTIAIRSGDRPPQDSFTAVEYREHWYWIAEDDFDSKVAFNVVQVLLNLAETAAPPGTVVTIPTR
jgi:hypothetical protein